MATNVIKIIDSQDKVVSQTQVASGKSITVSAKEGQSYEFVSGATKRAPDEIKTTREGNNLKVEIKDGDATSTVVVEDYYTNGEGDLIGLAEDGHFYNFVPEEMGNDYMVTDLADGVSSFQALGSEGDSMSPWWLGLPLLALGAAGGGGGSGSANTLPDAPNLLTVSDDYDALDNAERWGGDIYDRGSWVLDSTTGEWSVESGNVNMKDGKIITNDSTPGFSGTGEPGMTVRVYDGDVNPDNLVAETIVDSDGNWEITSNDYSRPLQETPPYLTNGDETSPLQNSEHTLNITLANGTGNESAPTPIDMIVDTLTGYIIGDLTFNKGEENAKSDNFDKVTGDDSHYYTEPFSISDTYRMEPGVNEQEIVSYQVDDEIYVTLVNQETGNKYYIAEQDPLDPSAAPTGYSTIVTDSSVGWSVTIYPNQLYYNATTKTWETLPDGHYANSVVVREVSGDVYSHDSQTFTSNDGTQFGSFGIDTTAPDASQIASITSPDHTLKINLDESTRIYEPESIDGYLTGLNVHEIIIYKDGDLNTPAADIYIAPDDNVVSSIWWDDTSITTDGVYTYQLETIDVAGHSSGVGETFYAVIDADGDGSYSGATANVEGTGGDEFFQTDVLELGFKLDGGAGVDTLVLNPTSTTSTTLTLDSNDTVNFEIYNLGTTATLKIDDLESVQNAGSEYTDHALTIQGKTGSEVDLDTAAWADTGVDQVIDGITYNVYHYSGADTSSDLWIQENVSVI